MVHYTASGLIKTQKKLGQDKRVRDVNENQDHLVTALDQVRSNAKNILLDGHFCLLDENSQPKPIATSTFENISPVTLILLEAPPSTIYARMVIRDPSSALSIPVIENLQRAERRRAKELSKHLNIPLFISDVETNSTADLAKDLAKKLDRSITNASTA